MIRWGVKLELQRGKEGKDRRWGVCDISNWKWKVIGEGKSERKRGKTR